MNGINKHSAEWMAIRAWNLAQIEKHRLALESVSCTTDEANQLRGMIAALREQIEHVEPTPKPEVKDNNYG